MDSFTKAYIECALWSSTDEEGRPLDKHYGLRDLHADTLARMKEDCERFIRDLSDRLHDVISYDREGCERAGRDFWLTRNRHGTGFWDGDWPDEAGTKLTEYAHSFGACELYVGHDNLIHEV